MWFKRTWFRFTGWLGLWPLWCKVYQWIELGAEEVDDPEMKWERLGPCDAQRIMNLLVWRPDGGRELFDAAHHPNYVLNAINEVIWANDGYQIFFGWKKYKNRVGLLMRMLGKFTAGKGQPKGSMDCEDFALWAATALKPQYLPRVLCVYWSTGRWPWQVEGHAVCLYKGESGLGYIGNWPHISGLKDVDSVVADILLRCGKRGSDLVAVREYEASELMIGT